MTDDTEKTLRRSINQSGLLFQEHPDVPGWRATRAAGPEVAAFTGKNLRPRFDRLSIKFYREGEEDADGVEYGADTWVLTFNDRGGYGLPRDVYTDRDAMVERVAEIMEQTSQRRTLAED